MNARKVMTLIALSGLALAAFEPSLAAAAEEAAHGAAAHGSDGHGGGAATQAHSFDLKWVQFVASLIVFAIAFWILAKFAWPRILGGLEDRESKIREEIFAAEQARERANAALEEYEKSLAEARSEAAAMLEQTKAEQARLAADLKAQAEAQRTEMLESARSSIEAAKRAALNELYNEAAVLATQVAEKILKREINVDDHRALVQESLSEVTNQFADTSA